MTSAWTIHLAAYRASHTSLSLKECMQAASKTYRSASKNAQKAEKTFILRFHVSGDPKLTDKEQKKLPPYGFDVAAWINGAIANECGIKGQWFTDAGCQEKLFDMDWSVTASDESKGGLQVTFESKSKDFPKAKKLLQQWLKKKFDKVVAK